MKWTLRQIAKQVNCSASTALNELRRGTPLKTGSRGRPPGYSAKRGQAVYSTNRSHLHKPYKAKRLTAFMGWVVEQVRDHHWSLDACVVHASLHGLFKDDEIASAKTLYNDLWAGRSPLSLFDMPDVLKRSRTKEKSRVNKCPKGTSIEQRPCVVDARIQLGYWEVATVVGLRNGNEAVVFTLIERVTDNYIAMQVSSKTKAAIQTAMKHSTLSMASISRMFSEASLSTTVRSLRTFLKWHSGAPPFTSPTHTPHGNGP